MRALIVDDSRTIRVVVGRIMQELGFEVMEAANGQEALDLLAANRAPDVVLADWNMPVVNGYELLCRLRADARWRTLPIVMVTTETDMHMMVRALEAGANEYIMKPFTQDVIREKLDLLQLSPS